ncbi:PREDICTED: mitochondrial amidoxime-reducing component 1 isoform X1 [Nicrophorus vespilloides]|uniref:Mitochondrial amidoxime-reducing component 1 isoform X1 n=1 Tax=Nicrophorus vespilloides TaxID=110193 RepID=A0ABM1N8U4_NICVS|nr:PREDICTED: mitochondrial amidoxime-reducing component 1 isoform X1 [Nicrophorus vespilloides]
MNYFNMQYTSGAAALGAIAATAIYYYLHPKNENLIRTWKAVGNVTKLHLHPLKSGRRLELTSADCTDVGIRQNPEDQEGLQLRDRTYLVYGEKNNEFKTARTFPQLLLVQMSVHDKDQIRLDAPGMPTLLFKVPTKLKNKELRVKVHQSEEIYSIDCGDEAANWISNYIHGDSTPGLRIGYHDGSMKHRRNILKIYKSFSIYKNLTNKSAGLYSDLSAVLLVNQASVDDLNDKLREENRVVSENFRSSITIAGEGAPAYAEDDWEWLKIGEAVFRNVKPCTRCIMTTINPDTGVRNPEREPLKTMETYRRLKNQKPNKEREIITTMGISMEVNVPGVIRINDTVYIA